MSSLAGTTQLVEQLGAREAQDFFIGELVVDATAQTDCCLSNTLVLSDPSDLVLAARGHALVALLEGLRQKAAAIDSQLDEALCEIEFSRELEFPCESSCSSPDATDFVDDDLDAWLRNFRLGVARTVGDFHEDVQYYLDMICETGEFDIDEWNPPDCMAEFAHELGTLLLIQPPSWDED